MTKRGPIEAITLCALSHSVVQAQMQMMRPFQVMVMPPLMPTLRSHLPSWISRSAARICARALRSPLTIEVKSLMTRDAGIADLAQQSAGCAFAFLD